MLVVALVVTLVPATAHAVPAAPTGLAPSGVQVDAGVPTLEWDRVRNAVKYEVEVVNPATGTSLFLVSTTNRKYVPTRYLPSQIEWRVRAIDAANVRGPWAEAAFSIDVAAGPKLTPPDPGLDGLLDQPDQPPVLAWERLRGAVSYIVEVSTDDFLTATKYVTTNPAFVVPAPMADGSYQWRVTADFGDGILSEPSETSTYTVGPLSHVDTAYPGDDIDFSIEDVYFDWEPVKGAVTYELWVSTDPDFNETSTVKTVGIKGTRYSPPTTYLNDQYYWKVRAVNSRTETIDWVQVDHRNFRRHWPDKPQLLHPADQLSPAVGDPLYFEWTPVEHASHYELEIGTDPNFSPNTYEVCRTASTTYTPEGFSDICTPSQGGVYYWRVRGIDNPKPVVGLYSEIRKFVYDSGAVQQVAPAPGASVPVPTLRWHASRDAERYVVWVTDANGNVATKDTYALSWTPSLKAANGPFTWTVQARDADGKLSPRYDTGRSFSIAGDPTDTAAAPLTPLSGTTSDAATTRFPALQWEPMTGAAYYKVEMRPHGSDYFYDSAYTSFLREKHVYPAATDTGAKFLTPGSYDWRVSAFASNDALLGAGPLATFTIGDLSDVTGQRIALTGSALDDGRSCRAFLDNPDGADICTDVPSTPVLEWDPVPGAAFYMVYLSRDRELTNMVMTPDSTVNTRWTPTLRNSPSVLPDSQAGKPYHWIIRPCKAVGYCAPDPVSTDESAMHAFDKVSPQPTQLSATTANDITFTWQDYLATNAATPYDATDLGEDERSYQSAMKYRIEVATTDSFTTLIDTREVDQTTYTPFDRTYPEGTLWWRVQATDGAGNRLTWSAPQSFVKSSGNPALVSPTDSLETDGLAPLRWEAQHFAKSYTVEVYKNNDDTTFSPANLLFRATTEQTAYVWDKPIPASDKSYVWRVRRNDADNRPGPWSDLGKFRSSGEAPSQTAPAPATPDGVPYVRGDEAEFAWTHVVGAKTYRVELRRVGSTSVQRHDTRVNAWTPTVSIADGSWEWRVSAIDTSNATIGSSPWQRFVVDATAPLVTSKSPTAKGKVSTNFVAKFSERVQSVTVATFTVKRKGTTKALPANVTLSSTGLAATLNPSANLKRGQVYIVSLTNGVTDPAGNRLRATSWKVTAR